ncbi:MAG: type IV toxin-antitoxin system AbiEi family antitoxin domain-containing protein [Longimicrobiales bacterium]
MSRKKDTSARTRTPDPGTRIAETPADASRHADSGTRIAEIPADARRHADPEARIAETPADARSHADIETRIAEIASRQHGAVTRAQLLAAGITAPMVDRRLKSRRLRPLHHGVYLHGSLVGSLEPARLREMAAVLACGPGSVVSHGSAAALWGLLQGEGDRSPVHVTIPGADRGRRPGIRRHKVANLPAEDAALVEGVPVTSPARTIVDLAALARPRALEQVLAEAERRELADLEGVSAALERAPWTTGATVLRQLIVGEPCQTGSHPVGS